MKKILLLATGGTIACAPGIDGLVPSLSGEQLVKLVPELRELAELTCVELMALDSSNLQPHHWQLMARELERRYFDYDGFVITHGTDTMAYTSAALTWMLQNLAKPVVLTGAQLPLNAPGSDAKKNLRHALQAATGCVSGVMLCFGRQIIGGANASKMYTEDSNAFVSVNAESWATFDGDEIKWSEAQLMRAAREKNSLRLGFKCFSNLEPRVAAITLTPGLSPEILRFYAAQGMRGLVLRGFGAGGVPNGENNWLPILEEVIHRGVRVVCASQCPFDGVNLHKYPIGTLAARLGARSAGTATLEAAVTHLMWELANK